MSRPLTKLPLVLAAFAIAVSACGSSTATPTTAPVATPTPAVAAATPTPAAVATPTPAAATSGQFCTGMKISFFPGGTAGGGFETVVYNGAKAAQAALGPDVTYQWSDWDPAKMITQFQQAVATKPDGVAIMGHPTDASFDALIDDAMKQGILITVMNTELPKAEAAHSLGYTGATNRNAGVSLANQAIASGKIKKGDEVFVWGLKAQAPGRGDRTLGITDTLTAAGMKVDYLEIDAATNKDPNAGTATFTGFMASHPNVKAIFLDHGNLTAAIPALMKAANLQAGSVYAAGFDLQASTIQGIKDGYINVVLDQQEWLQGFFGIEQLCLEKKYGFGGLFIDTGAGFVDKTNVDAVSALVKQQIR